MQTWTMSHRGADRIENNKINASLRAGEIKYLVIEMPTSSRELPADKMTHFLRLVSKWVDAAKPHLQHGTVVAIVGTMSRHWQEPALKDLIASSTLYMSYHRCCHFGLKIGSQDQPSSACLMVASNVEIEGHLCKCQRRDAAAHNMDWHTPDARHQRATVKKKMLEHILRRLRTTSSNTTPDSNDSDLNINLNENVNVNVNSNIATKNKNIGIEKQAAYPTAARERQKERQQANKTPVQKRPQIIEEHYDDCGSSLEGLKKICGDILLLTIDLPNEYFITDDELWQPQLHGLFNTSCFFGYECGQTTASGISYAQNLAELEMRLFYSSGGDRSNTYLDVVELCGGQARVSTICYRRRMLVGPNFDIIDINTQCDLNDEQEQRKVLGFLNKYKPLVTVMAPTCTPYGPLTTPSITPPG